MKKRIVLKKDQKLTLEQAKELFGDHYLDYEIRFNLETKGPWSIVSKLSGLCARQNFGTGDITIYGNRSMSDLRESGYEMEGRVSIDGKKYTCFTTSHLFELENGHLISVAIIFPRIK